jgi:peroxiredoxin
MILAATTFGMPVAQSQLPPSKGAPKVGEKAPDFTLLDSTGKPFTLSDLFSGAKQTPAASERPAWVLLIFYRGYW